MTLRAHPALVVLPQNRPGSASVLAMAPEPDDHPTLYIRVPPPLKAAVVAYGKALGVSQNAAAILLLRRGLKLDPMPATDPAATEALGASLRRQIGLSDDPFEEMRGIDL